MGSLINMKIFLDIKTNYIETPLVRFLIGNYNSHYSELINFIESSLKGKLEKPNILLFHHRIWDDALTSSRPHSHDKSYYLKNIFYNVFSSF